MRDLSEGSKKLKKKHQAYLHLNKKALDEGSRAGQERGFPSFCSSIGDILSLY